MIKRNFGRLLALGGLAIGLSITAEGREWKSADGAKSFEAEFVSAADGKITVKRSNGKTMTFPATVVSEADQKWVTDEQARLEKAAADKAEAEKLATAPVPSALDGHLVKVDGKRFSKFEPEVPSKYYILYFSASW